MSDTIKFGPAGNSKSFYDAGFKHSYQMPKYIEDKSLGWYEYSCGKGANLKQETAQKIGQEAKKHNIGMSIHAPYYINLSNPEEEKRQKSREYIYQTLQLAHYMEATRVVFHPGACMKQSRGVALNTALREMEIIIDEMDQQGFQDVIICPETMGKKNQLGTLDEVIQLCLVDERIVPTIDFGHLNSRGQGCIESQEDYAEILDIIESALGSERLNKLHIHFSHQEYTNMGEKKHLTFEDIAYGPFFEALSKEIVKRKMTPVIICESRDTMIEDALIMKKIYQQDLL
ncbi:MAG: TIM barrel protein [Clostridiales bacterium]|nr:TIM barrel protein [Clostridiales bacterium]